MIFRRIQITYIIFTTSFLHHFHIIFTISWITVFLNFELTFLSGWEKFNVIFPHLSYMTYKNTYFLQARFQLISLADFFDLSNRIPYTSQSILTGYAELIFFAFLFLYLAILGNFTLAGGGERGKRTQQGKERAMGDKKIKKKSFFFLFASLLFAFFAFCLVYYS